MKDVRTGRRGGASSSDRARVRAGRASCAWLALSLLVAAGCGGRAVSPPPPDPDPMDRQEYVIGVTDVLRISVWKQEDLSVDVPVRPDGKISVPLLDDVQAEGLTPEELKEVLTREFAEYVTEPHVTIVVLGLNSRKVSILGGVRRPGQYDLPRNTRVLEAIAGAGGFSEFAQKNDVRIVRRDREGSEHEYRFDYGAYINGKAPGTNIVLVSGDTIIVPD